MYLLLALLYVAIVAARGGGELEGDEWRYTFYADNLLRGYYSPPGVTFLWNGPGYPLLLAPIAALGLSWEAARYLNVILMLGAVACFRAAAGALAERRWALGATVVFGLYPPLLFFLHLVYSEVLATFLLVAFALGYLAALRHGGALRTIAAGALLGCLALTKILFGPVLVVWAAIALVGAAGVALAGVVRGRSLAASAPLRALLRTVAVAGIALAVCAPYLSYTHRLTGRTFYWGSASGMSLYFMSSPYEGESGDWYHQRMIRRIPRLRRHHLATLDRIGRFGEVPEGSPLGELHFLSTDEADAEFKRLAVANIRAHPGKYAQNWVANVSRLLFDVPYSYNVWPRDPLVFAINGPILALFGLAVGLAWRRRVRWDWGTELLLLLLVGALGGNSLLSAVGRYSAPILPLVGLWTLSALGRALPALAPGAPSEEG